MPLNFATRLDKVETSAIRELFKLLGKPGIISFAGGFPDSAMFDVEGLREASQRALAEEPGGALQYGATEGYEPLRAQLAAFEVKHPIAGRRQARIVCRDDRCQAEGLMHVPQQIVKRSSGALVEIAGRFVRQQDRRTHDERPCNSDALLLAS